MTKEKHYFNSMHSVEKVLGVDRGLVRRICEGEYGYRRSRSKMDDYYYTFEYIN